MRSDVIELKDNLQTSRYGNEQTTLFAAVIGTIIGGVVTTVGLYIGIAMKITLEPMS